MESCYEMNTFTDFIDCGEALVEKGYTSPDHVCNGWVCWRVVDGCCDEFGPELFNGVLAEKLSLM